MYDTNLPHPTPAPRRHRARFPHVAGLSLALLLGLATSAPARAGLVIQSGVSVISADTSDSALETDTLSATSGFANAHQVVSLDSPGEKFARALSVTDFIDNAFSAVGGVDLFGLSRGDSAQASVFYTLLFTLTGHHTVTADMEFISVGPGNVSASMDLSLEGGGSLLSHTLDTLTAPLVFELTLGPGTYRFVGESQVQHSGLLSHRLGAEFRAVMLFTEIGDPGNDVPEPASLALALSGLLACGVVRRRRQEPADRVQRVSGPRDATK